MENRIRIGFTLGDVNGIGPEVVIKALEDKRMLGLCTPVIYGSNRIISFYKKLFNLEGLSYTTINSADQANAKAVNIINCITQEVMIMPGQENETGARVALTSLEAATNDLLKGQLDAIVTAPINKHNLQSIGFNYPGHTEYFNAKAPESESVMLLMQGDLRVGLATGHIPVKDVASALTKEGLLRKLEIIHHSLKQDFASTGPRIAVLGLNPHAGDSGTLGAEESNIIIPAIKAAQEKKMFVTGPFSADGFFGSGQYQHFDAILAMYHDQGLAPFKTIAYEEGVNYTAGMPFIRTSPDHGVAYDIAGKNLADEQSFSEAIFTAIKIFKNRTEYQELIENRLKPRVLANDNGIDEDLPEESE